MNRRSHVKSRMIIAGLWLIGLGVMLETRWMWQGILLLGGATALVTAYYHPERRGAARAGTLMMLIALWAAMRFSLPVLFLGVGGVLIVSALMSRDDDAKTYVDSRLD